MGYKVNIFGQAYSLKADADEEHVKSVANLVDAKMREIARNSKASALQAAVLAALDLGSEFISAKNESVRLQNEAESRIEAMSQRIEALLHRRGDYKAF